jgi:NADPH:quinone reductase-like Zn-dependent oxidoreductase
MRRHFQSPGAATPLGYASAGEIVDAGPGVDAGTIGATVLSFGFSGAYAEYRAVPYSHCFPVPAGLDASQAVAGFIGPATAALAVDLAGIRAGEIVLVLGGAGGVGFAAMQMARNLSARPVAVVRSAASQRRLRERGFDAVLTGEKADLADAIAASGADVLIDTVGGDALTEALESVVDGGRVMIVGIAGAGDKIIDTSSILTRRLTVRGCFLGAVIAEPPARSIVARALSQLAEGRIEVPVQQIFALEEAVAAHALAETPNSLGKVVMVPVENAV